MEVKNIGVIGAGAMGSGIAQVSAVAGYDVVLQDIYSTALDKAKSTIEKSLGKLVSKGKLSEADMKAAMERITFTTVLEEACRDAELIIECVFENLELKQKMFQEFEKLCKPEAILGTNTSALPITEIASVTKRGDKVIGIHFMNPVPLMKGVEIIRGQLTSDETMETTLEYIKKIGKEPAIAVDYAGFIVSRLLDVLMNEAVKLMEEGNKPEEIDKAMQLCAGHPMGPCKLLDLVGAEIAMHGMETMERDFGPKYKPHPLLKKRVLAGLLGVKTGKGFYEY
ncbi:3-hydroxyacyl-CoA dehydrogenase family protein [Syntrophothermus lipocalidus]|uniref:3-hydroxybutyryl-CoA dehydrogenase n=1 Tax=Syntrophothermus lipocalidus (strain DSM 12680 / TGB-C1) TaxID=643648 RepID=D7CIV7_SYNLT|nr:3-hydroxyacyl-CoA dehydrogenase family protein [Syntrophothermus lipocalidus]ADI02835.1 3-hydroxyacyl-CoA dehydrogenase NAD-binding protein [Syntrophothermus lipocalidus DSM 12680]